ncbi:hypothetical protein RJT34_12778 [Clitoria ternatea]|uniref:Uncharacterized protein n=1 Tax=Clitoria ternatea TaxID=43366 RepID=A0AAN9JPH2_CLITE
MLLFSIVRIITPVSNHITILMIARIVRCSRLCHDQLCDDQFPIRSKYLSMNETLGQKPRENNTLGQAKGAILHKPHCTSLLVP